MNCWTILQIEPTKDLKKIKHAYAVLTKQYHPEDNPEKFQEIQEAYQRAVAYAKDNSLVSLNPNIPLTDSQMDMFQTEETSSSPDDGDDGETDDYYENLFERHKEEMQEKIREQGMFFKHKI